MSKMRGSKPTGEARSARVATQGLPSGALGYAKKGQMVMRGMAHGGKPSMKMGTGYYPNPPVGPGKHK